MANIQENINNLSEEIARIEEKLPYLKYYAQIAYDDITKIMDTYQSTYFEHIMFALRETSDTCAQTTDPIALNSITELKQYTLEKISDLEKIINLYKDTYREHQCLVIQHLDLVERSQSSGPIQDTFSKLAEIVSEGVEN